MQKQNISRRKFMGQASCGAIGLTSLFSTLFNLKTVNAAAAFNSSVGAKMDDYKAMVCILNSGGMDSFNMLVPRGASYAEYAASRSNMALNQNELLPINPLNPDGKTYGLHPNLVHCQQLFESGKMSFVSNVGTLLQPINKQQFYNGSIPVPLGLYSHSDQVMQWQTSILDKRSGVGWGGKIADLLTSANENQILSMNISLAGSNIFQSGNNSVEYSIHHENGSTGIFAHNNEDWVLYKMKTAAINDMVNPGYQNVFKNTYRKTIKKGIDGHEMLSPILQSQINFDLPFSDTDLSKSFQMIAKTIAGRDTLKMSRQIFFIDFGGWDHHDSLLDMQSNFFTVLDNALNEFNAAMQQLGVHDKVTTFSLSEFSRTLTSNGNGTDHAWGSNVFVMGGSVQGRKILGNYPSLSLTNFNSNPGSDTNPLDVGGGVLIPTTSVEEYFAELALWYGVPSSELVTLFPNLGYFYDPMSGSNPIGFLNL